MLACHEVGPHKQASQKSDSRKDVKASKMLCILNMMRQYEFDAFVEATEFCNVFLPKTFFPCARTFCTVPRPSNRLELSCRITYGSQQCHL
jgi:hypothetical protein